MSSSKTLTTFTLFPTLPSELRCKIWAAACFPRILSLIYDSSTSTSRTTTSPPAILSVSCEARGEGFRTYSQTFGTSTQPASIPFNPYLDTLYLPRCGEMGYDDTLRDFRAIVSDPSNLLDKVRSIALDVVSLDIKRPWEGYNKATLLRSFQNLDQVILVLGSPTQDADLMTEGKRDIQFVQPKADPEKLLRIWYYFRQSFIMEEKILEDVCQANGTPYEAFSLPTLKIRSKISLSASLKIGNESVVSAMERIRI